MHVFVSFSFDLFRAGFGLVQSRVGSAQWSILLLLRLWGYSRCGPRRTAAAAAAAEGCSCGDVGRAGFVHCGGDGGGATVIRAENGPVELTTLPGI